MLLILVCPELSFNVIGLGGEGDDDAFQLSACNKCKKKSWTTNLLFARLLRQTRVKWWLTKRCVLQTYCSVCLSRCILRLPEHCSTFFVLSSKQTRKIKSIFKLLSKCKTVLLCRASMSRIPVIRSLKYFRIQHYFVLSKIFYKLSRSAGVKSSERSAKPFLFNCLRVEMRHTQ